MLRLLFHLHLSTEMKIEMRGTKNNNQLKKKSKELSTIMYMNQLSTKVTSSTDFGGLLQEMMLIKKIITKSQRDSSQKNLESKEARDKLIREDINQSQGSLLLKL
jgi:hypothetical protein